MNLGTIAQPFITAIASKHIYQKQKFSGLLSISYEVYRRASNDREHSKVIEPILNIGNIFPIKNI